MAEAVGKGAKELKGRRVRRRDRQVARGKIFGCERWI